MGNSQQLARDILDGKDIGGDRFGNFESSLSFSHRFQKCPR
jgi:hypothetical protein